MNWISNGKAKADKEAALTGPRLWDSSRYPSTIFSLISFSIHQTYSSRELLYAWNTSSTSSQTCVLISSKHLSQNFKIDERLADHLCGSATYSDSLTLALARLLNLTYQNGSKCRIVVPVFVYDTSQQYPRLRPRRSVCSARARPRTTLVERIVRYNCSRRPSFHHNVYVALKFVYSTHMSPKMTRSDGSNVQIL